MRNTLKWSSIPLLIPTLLQVLPRSDLRNAIFFTPTQATQKYDGTNVGKDENGTMYGRNLLIEDSATSYQKTPLDCVRSVNVASMKAQFCTEVGLEEESISCFNLYGELMCNKSLFNYATDRLGGTYQFFGAMIKPQISQNNSEILEKINLSPFACAVPGQDEEEDETTEVCGSLMLFMNPALQALVSSQGCSTVPIVGQYSCLYDLVCANYEWMINGMGEGLVLISPATGSNCKVSKWKIGAEANTNNIKFLGNILEEITADIEQSIFAEDTTKAKDFFTMLLAVANSKKVNGQDPAPPKVVTPPVRSGPVVLSPEKVAEYNEAIKSAQTKFDHPDSFFVRNMKGADEYAALLAEECLSDIAIDRNDASALQQHNNYIKGVVKEMFVAFKRNNAKK